MRNVITIELGGSLYNGVANHLALDLLSRGYEVRSVAVARADKPTLMWEPTYRPGERVRIEGSSHLGTVLDIRSWNRERVQYHVQWDDADAFGTLWCDEIELDKAEEN